MAKKLQKKPQTATVKPSKPGQKPIKYRKGGLHESLGVAKDKSIPKGEFQAALAGRRGPLAHRQAHFKQNVLTGKR